MNSFLRAGLFLTVSVHLVASQTLSTPDDVAAFLESATTLSTFGGTDDNFTCSNPSTDKVALPNILAAADQYFAEIGTINMDSALIGAVQEIRLTNQRAVSAHNRKDSTVRSIFTDGKDSSYYLVKDESSCTLIDWAKEESTVSPFMIDFGSSKWRWTGLNSILAAVAKDQTNSQNTAVEGSAVWDSEWRGCLSENTDTANTSTYLDIAITYNTKQLANAPLLVTMQTYDKDQKVSHKFSLVIILSKLDAAAVTKYSQNGALQLPRGVFCEGAPKATVPSFVLNHFTTAYKYTDQTAKTIATGQLSYSKSGDVMSVDVSGPVKQAPFYDGVMADNKGLIIRDYVYGTQNVIESSKGVCLSSSLMDIKVTGDKIKPSDQILAGGDFEKMEFFDAGMTACPIAGECQIFSGRVENSTDEKVYELVFTNTPWTTSAGSVVSKNRTLVSVGVFEKSALRTLISYDSVLEQPMLNYAAEFDVTPCMKQMQYLSINVSGVKMGEISSELGYSQIEGALIEHLASAANISHLRICPRQIYLFPTGDDLVVFFSVSGPLNGKANTDQPRSEQATSWMAEPSLRQAVDSLNSTIHDNVLVIKFTDKLSMTVQQGSLLLVTEGGGPRPAPTPAPGPLPSTGGMGGGAVFALCLMMLLLGSVMGIMGAWWMWKRNRGIAYQVYE